ncbi:RNA polymerase II subunit A C-terminal domain phosphatase SSU72 isoform X1 [Lucilia sericata]|uniref:RNA polymerase II subunit A C-terminal domain phosphatase SSU72 isoform X1 n=1 Tax=Lucilia sericata TaxID=13632 RepID=UPI0018A848D4|nr:RNA polymerase II subunit A C-terminal domain phosphatase SSU72 isoform X1 [Lucilia sericata]
MSLNNGLSIAVVCSSNMNRSMEAHNFLAKKGYNVRSFGTGERVKLPGTAIDKPNVYEFGTPYDTIYNDLVSKDKQYYTQNGLLHMLDRNRRIKKCPERFQDCREQFDIIVTVEERVYDQVLENMESRDVVDNRPVHIFNVDIEDNHEEALMGAFLITDMINMVKIYYNYSYKLLWPLRCFIKCFSLAFMGLGEGRCYWQRFNVEEENILKRYEINDKTILFYVYL